MLKILFIATECTPFAKTGGLGDVIESLPIALGEKKLMLALLCLNTVIFPQNIKKRNGS